jgi:hypothetical protein
MAPMSNKAALLEALAPVLEIVRTVDPADPQAAAILSERLPLDDPRIAAVARTLRAAVAAGENVCHREAGGVRYSRVLKAAGDDLSVDAVHMSAPGPGHLHPNGEMDLCFATDGTPTFDGNAPGWTVYPPGSWHVPTVASGTMDILYFLPGGAIQFGPKPS